MSGLLDLVPVSWPGLALSDKVFDCSELSFSLWGRVGSFSAAKHFIAAESLNLNNKELNNSQSVEFLYRAAQCCVELCKGNVMQCVKLCSVLIIDLQCYVGF